MMDLDGIVLEKQEAMLPAFIIEQIRQEEERRRRESGVPARIDIDDREPLPDTLPRQVPDIDGNRGVVIIEQDEDVYNDSRVCYSVRYY